MSHSESELKFELAQADYEKLVGSLVALEPPRIFSNGYFTMSEDTDRRDWVLRLRSESEQGPGELTLKVGREREPGMFCSQEYTAIVSTRDPNDWGATEPLQILRSEISNAAIVGQGESHNERRVVSPPFGSVDRWEIDRTELPDGSVFFELEIEWPADETPDEAEILGYRKRLESWFREAGLSPLTASRKTKYRRFLEAVGSGLE